MKNFFKTKTGWDNDNTSLPEYLRIYQYDHITETGLDPESDPKVGTMGNNYLDFVADRNFANYYLLNNTTDTGLHISRQSLYDRFYVLEIPDYGHQALSQGSTDFKCEIWVNGLKIPNTYISMLRHYTTKMAYLFIRKDIVNYELIGNIVIRVVFQHLSSTLDTNGFNKVTTNSVNKLDTYRVVDGSSKINENLRNFSAYSIKPTEGGDTIIHKQGEYFGQILELDNENPIVRPDVTINGDIIPDISSSEKSEEFVFNEFEETYTNARGFSCSVKTIMEGESDTIFSPSQAVRSFVWKFSLTSQELADNIAYTLLRKSNIYPLKSDNEFLIFNSADQLIGYSGYNDLAIPPGDNGDNYTIIMYDNGSNIIEPNDSELLADSLQILDEVYDSNFRTLSDYETPFDMYSYDINELEDEIREAEIFPNDKKGYYSEVTSVTDLDKGIELYYDRDSKQLLNSNEIFDDVSEIIADIKDNTGGIESNISFDNTSMQNLRATERGIIEYISLSEKEDDYSPIKHKRVDNSSEIINYVKNASLILLGTSVSSSHPETVPIRFIDNSGIVSKVDVANLHRNINMSLSGGTPSNFDIIPIYGGELYDFQSEDLESPVDNVNTLHILGKKDDEVWMDPSTPDLPAGSIGSKTYTIYFKPPREWISDDDTVFMYTWRNSVSGAMNAPWPGLKMEKESDGVFKLNTTDFYDMIIFNDGSGRLQTRDLSIDFEKPVYVYDKGWYDKSDIGNIVADDAKFYVYCKLPTNYGTNVYAYAWDSSVSEIFGTWPGRKMEVYATRDGCNIFRTNSKIDIMRYSNIVFHTNNNNQTADLKIGVDNEGDTPDINRLCYIPGKGWNSVDSSDYPSAYWSLRETRSQVKEPNILSVRFRTPADWENAYIYLWTGSSQEDNLHILAQWPGVPMLLSQDATAEKPYREFEFEYNTSEYENVIFNRKYISDILLPSGITITDIWYIDGSVNG